MALFGRDPDDDDDDAGDGTRFWEERGFVAATIVIGAVLVCLLVWFFLRGGSGTPASAPTVTPTNVIPTERSSEEPSVPPATPTGVPLPGGTTTPTTPPPLNSATGGCRNKHPDQAEPVVAPPAVTWQFEGDLLIPLQAAGGPATTSASGVRSCFAHSQTGVVLATMVLLGQIVNRSLTEQVLLTRCLPGPGQTQALADLRAPATPATKAQVQFAGFKILDYEPTKAILQIAVQLNHQSYGSLPVTMKWVGGDWKAALKADGSFNGTVAPDVLSSLDGYVRFAGAA
jgi:hypothetical protein